MFNLLPSHCFVIIKSVPFQVSVLENERMHVAVRSILQLTVLALLGAPCCLAGSYDFLSLNPPESPIIIKFFRRITILQHRIKCIFSFLSPGIKYFRVPAACFHGIILNTLHQWLHVSITAQTDQSLPDSAKAVSTFFNQRLNQCEKAKYHQLQPFGLVDSNSNHLEITCLVRSPSNNTKRVCYSRAVACRLQS